MITPNLKTKTACRVCSSELQDILDLGNHYLHRCILPWDTAPEYQAPLKLTLCKNCKLLQLRHTVPKDNLFREYFYSSGVNQTMRNALANVVFHAEQLVKLDVNDIVVDIGSNDSTLLRSYVNPVVKIGFEPARNLMEKARADFEGTIINDYFTTTDYWAITGKKAKIITAIAVFYDLDDPVTFLRDVSEILHDEGLFIVQMNYMPLMLWHNSFDNIVHEHLFYAGLLQMERMLRDTGLAVKDVEFNDVNGGSFRLYIGKRFVTTVAHIETPAINIIRQYERVMRLDDPTTYTTFANRIKGLKSQLQDMVHRTVINGKTVYGYGASTRGSTTLQFCEFTNTEIKAIAERNPSKWGTHTSGTHIPIISEEQMRKDHPDYLLILPWQFLPEFKKREKEYLKAGKFIVPMPNVKVIP